MYYGRRKLPVCRKITTQLLSSLETGSAVRSNTTCNDWRGKSYETTLHSGAIKVPPKGANYGDPLPKNKLQYRKGETVVAEFWSSNPTAYYITGNNYLLVEIKTSTGWQPVASDSDWDTTIKWRKKRGSFVARLSWHTAVDVAAGDYRITHLGQDTLGGAFTGVSDTIQIK